MMIYSWGCQGRATRYSARPMGAGRRELNRRIMEAITVEEIADLLVNIGLDEGCDYDDETIQPVLDTAWSGDGYGEWNPAIGCIVELLKKKMTDSEFATLRHLVVQGMTCEE
ncbi:MAG: hypothetical protein ACRDS1_07395 [Pseudonocardiaceae bacterium]